jgi:hypothetical protein
MEGEREDDQEEREEKERMIRKTLPLALGLEA